MSKFFVEPNQINGSVITLTGADVNHIAKVLRHTVGDVRCICDGMGIDYEAQITAITREAVTLSVCGSKPCKTEPGVEVTLYQGLPKQGKMEWIIEKCTEMGISSIVPVQMERSVVRLTAEQAEKKLVRWQKTAEAAAKQCGRGKIPTVHMPILLSEISQQTLPEFLLLPYEEETSQTVREALRGRKTKSAGIFIGPEGGFVPEEAAFLQRCGAQSVTLGPRILRTETAGLAALTVLLYEWGEMETV